MAEARSYARQGQFSNRIQAPQAAKAKRQRDKEMVAELKEQNRDLKDRDAQFLAAYKEKIAKEKAARGAVEEARRYSVEAERRQRERNFQLSADFAEQEQKAQNEIFEVFGDLLPELGTLIGEEGKRRKEAEQKNAEAITQKVGLTQKQIKELRAVTWTADVLAAKKYEKLRSQLEAGGMTHKQFLDAMNRQGVWGTAFARYDLIQRARALPSLVTKAIEEGYEYNGVTLKQAFESEVVGNNREVIDHFIRETIGRTYEGYNAAFVQKTIGKDIERWQNSLQAKRYKKEQEQASATIEENLNQTLTSNLSGIDSYEATLAACGDNEVCRYNIVKRDGIRIAELIKKGMISPEAVDTYLRTKVWNTTLNNGEGARNAIGEDNRGMGHIIAEARANYQAELQRQARVGRAQDWESSKQAIHDHQQAMESMDPDQAVEYVRSIIEDPNQPTSVKEGMFQYLPKTDRPSDFRNWYINRQIDNNIKHGIPIDPKLLIGASGQVYARGMKIIAEQNSMATWDKVAKDSTKGWVDGVTGRDNNFDRGHKDFPQVHMLLQRRYKEIQKGFIERRGTNGLTDIEIHNTALKQLEDEWNAGTKGDEAGRTGQFRYIVGDDPTTGEFTEIYKVGTPRVQPKITESHKIWGEGLVNQPEAVFTKSRTESFQKGIGAITKSDWDRAWDTADLTGITAAEVIVRQMEANGHTPPPALVQSADARRTLSDISYNMNQTFRNASLPGEQNRDWLHTSANANRNAIPGITRIIGPFGVQGVTSVPTDTNAAHSGPIKGHYDVEFVSPELALYVGKYLLANGITATEHPGLPGGVSNVHAYYPKSHYNGFKIDIPFSQTGSTGSIGTNLDKAFAIRVMQLMREAATQFYNRA